MDISEYDDIIDSRDVIQAIDELATDLFEHLPENCDVAATEELHVPNVNVLRSFVRTGEGLDLDPAGVQRYLDLVDLVAELREIKGDTPEDGQTLVRDSHFEDFAREEAEEAGMLDDSDRWPVRHIDWEAAAQELKGDYTEVDLRGTSYWVRSV